jgi:hypothetical protein
MCSGRGTSDADKNREIPSVALQQESLFTLKDRAENLWRACPKWHVKKIFGPAAFFVVPIFILFYFFFYPTILSIPWGTRAHAHISESVEFMHELQLLLNSSASEMFLHKSGAMRSVDWIFITGVSAWRWLGEYMTLDRTLYNFSLKQDIVAAPVTATFSSLPHSSSRPLLEM